MILKPTANLIAVTSANACANSTLVRIHTSAATVVTINTSTGNYVGSFSMPADTVEIVEKSPTDTITCSASANCTPVAYKH
jgi:NAD kinase